MIASYSTLFEINSYHSYYKDGICKGLVYTPSDSTKELMKRYGYQLMITSSGFLFCGDKRQTSVDFLEYLKSVTDAISFEFTISTLNDAFYQITACPVNTLGHFSYNSNRIKEEGETIALNQEFQTSGMPSNLGMLQINFQDLIVLQKKYSKTQLDIHFTARATQWKYNIINNSQQHFDELHIKAQDAINFGTPEKVTLQNNIEALCFSSGAQKIPLKEVPEHQFNLISKTETLGSKRTKVVFKGLPYPDPSQIAIYKENGTDQVTSLMYIYI